MLTDLIESGKINGIKRMVIEYHHRIDGVNSCLARFLKLLEEQGLEYQLAASCGEPVGCQNGFQDILISACPEAGTGKRQVNQSIRIAENP